MNIQRKTHVFVFNWGVSILFSVTLYLAGSALFSFANEPEQQQKNVYLSLIVAPSAKILPTATPTITHLASPIDGPQGPGGLQPPGTATPNVAPLRPTLAVTMPPDGFGAKPTASWTATPTVTP